LPEIAAGGQTPARETLDLLEDCVSLFDEIDGHIASLDPPAQEIAKHVCDRLQEILERAGMEVIAEDGVFNRRLHRPEKKGSGNNGDDSQWHARILSPGFQLDRRVYRKARVSLRPGGDGATTGQGSGA
jgi:molecular chaperone GrpE (heat shock protein)